MGASLSLSISESSLSQANNTSKVTVTVKVTSTSGSWNGSSRSGSVTIDGTSYSFSHSFSSNTTTTLATKSKTVTHNSSGGGSIKISAKYSTGVSAGTITTSKTYTLKTIDRTFTVKYSANGGSGAPSSQTKMYGKTLTLRTAVPTRTGYTFKEWNTSSNGSGTSYKSGGSYTKNSDVTLYAIWEEKTYTFTFSTTKVSAISSVTVKYSEVFYLPNPTQYYYSNNYYIDVWKSSSSTEHNPGAIVKYANSEPMYGTSFTSVEKPYTIKLYFMINGTRSSYYMNVTYQETFYYPTLDYVIEHSTNIDYTVPEDKEFIGWGSSSATQFTGQLYRQTVNVGGNGSGSRNTYFYVNAFIEDKDRIPIRYWKIDSIEDGVVNYVQCYVNRVNYGDSYKVEDISEYIGGSVDGYKFANCFRQSLYPTNPNWQQEGVSSERLFSYSFNPTFDDRGYNEEYDLVDETYTIDSVKDVSYYEFYAVYKDNSSSGIKYKEYVYDYVDSEQEKSLYLSYLTGKISEFESSLYSSFAMVSFKFDKEKTDTLNTSSLKCDIYDKDDEDTILETLDEKDCLITLEDSTYYIIVENTKEFENYMTSSYVFRLSGLSDSLGRSLDSVVATISPPAIIRDISKSGKAVSLFKAAPDNNKYNNDGEFHVGGSIIANGLNTNYLSITEFDPDTSTDDPLNAKTFYEESQGEKSILQSKMENVISALGYDSDRQEYDWSYIHLNSKSEDGEVHKVSAEKFIIWLLDTMKQIIDPDKIVKEIVMNSYDDTEYMSVFVDGDDETIFMIEVKKYCDIEYVIVGTATISPSLYEVNHYDGSTSTYIEFTKELSDKTDLELEYPVKIGYTDKKD